MTSAAKGPGDLKKEVLDSGLCTACGMCVGMCPYIKTIKEKIVIIQSCGLKEGNCYRVCPRTGVDVAELDRFVFGRERADQALGVNRGIYFARACDPATARAGQYGGVVSSLMAFAVGQGLIEGAVMAGGTALNPEPVLAKTGHKVLSCSGSRYTAVPTLKALNGAAREGVCKAGVVGRPCQVAAVRKGQWIERRDSGPGIPFAGVDLVIGLFCFWSLKPDFYGYLEEMAAGEEILRVDIPLEGLTVTTARGSEVRPVEGIRPYIKDSCHACIDSTSEWADLSVGSTEYDPSWNTLVVRTEAGRALVDRAAERGVIDLKPYPEERLPLLRKAALNKKMRVLHDPGLPRPEYLVVPGEYLEGMRKQWEVLQK